MHLSIFQAQAFGHRRLPPHATAAVLRHLDTGCGACRARLAPWLIPWLDPAPASEARATDPARCGPALAAEYQRAARRAARAAVRMRAEDAARADDRDTRRVLFLLDREGPAAIGRLPRRLLGRPAVAALLRQIELRGTEHPRLRLRLAELAWDLASRWPGAERQLPPLAVAAGIEMANACRVMRHPAAARAWLDAMRDHVGAAAGAPRIMARLEQIEGALAYSVGHPAAAKRSAERAAAVNRRAADPIGLAQALCSMNYACDARNGFQNAIARSLDALTLCDPDRAEPARVSAIGSLCMGLVASGQWERAKVMVKRFRSELATRQHGHLAVDRHVMEADLLDHEGRHDEALQAFAAAATESIALGDPYREATSLLFAAASLERRGELPRSAAFVREATDLLLAGAPGREVHVTATFLRLRSHLSALREALPLGPVLHFLEHARTDPEARLASYLG